MRQGGPPRPWSEFGLGVARVPISEFCKRYPGTAVPEDGCLLPSDAPGLGLEVTREMLEAATA